MITSLRLVNFKNFADETLRVGSFTVIVGANASGKSNIRDAFRFLHSVGCGNTLAGIFGGKYGGPRIQEWEPIRGAPNEIVRFGSVPSGFSLQVELKSSGIKTFYSITVKYEPDNSVGFYVLQEDLKIGLKVVYTAKKTQDTLLLVAGEEKKQKISFSPYKPALSDFYQTYKFKYLSEAEASFQDVLDGMCFIELVPERMREPSFPSATKLGGTGENLPTALEAICVDPERKKILADWLQELTPMDVRDFEFPRDPSGRVHLQIVEGNGRKVSAYSGVGRYAAFSRHAGHATRQRHQ